MFYNLSLRSRSVLVMSALMAVSGAHAADKAEKWTPSYSLYDSRSNNMPDSGLAGGAEGTFNLTSGNTRIQNLGGSAAVGYRADAFTVTAKASALSMKSQGDLLNQAIVGQGRVGANVTKGLDFFVQGLFFRNPFTGVRQQYHMDGGFGIYPVSTDNLEVRLEVAAGYLRENYVDFGRTVNFANRENFATARGGIGIKLKVSETADLLADGSWIHNFENAYDHRVITTVGIQAAVTQIVSLKVGFNYMFRNLELPGYKDHDATTTAGIVLKL